MADQNIVQTIGSIIQQILGSGIALNGQIGINGLTITSFDKAKEQGILSQHENASSQASSKDEQGSSGQQKQSSQSSQSGGNSRDTSEQKGEGISQDEISSLREEIRYLRTLMESQQEQSGQKNRSSQSK